jgi:DNA-binding transcriptional MerR regulator
MKRRGNRRYYQHHEVLMIRRIRDLLYDQGFTISGARNKMQELLQLEMDCKQNEDVLIECVEVVEVNESQLGNLTDHLWNSLQGIEKNQWQLLRSELSEIREILSLRQ